MIRYVWMLAVLGMIPSAEAGGPAVPGKLLFEDDFARPELPPKWKVGKGSFEVKDRVVTASEIPEDKHGAYAYVQPRFQFKDIVVEFSAMLAGSRACHLMVNDSNYKEAHAGHILRASLLPGKVDLADYKYGLMKNEIFEKVTDPNTPAEEKKRLRDGIKDKGAVFKTATDLAQWHAVRVEILGDEMFVSLDGNPAGYLKSAGLDHPTKNALGFEIAGRSSLLKDMKVWDASPAADLASRRDAFLAALNK